MDLGKGKEEEGHQPGKGQEREGRRGIDWWESDGPKETEKEGAEREIRGKWVRGGEERGLGDQTQEQLTMWKVVESFGVGHEF